MIKCKENWQFSFLYLWKLMFVFVLCMYFNLQPTEFRAEILFNTKIASYDVECFKMVWSLSDLKEKYFNYLNVITCPSVKQCIGASSECFRKSSSTNAKQYQNFLRKNNHLNFQKLQKIFVSMCLQCYNVATPLLVDVRCR